ncbi:MAG: zinc dependent phospholipase C family protein [Bacillales bacterium]|jgi:hypothetical protein|nr:zinc dependent phospholipase C family protein [Bacillales bacterium]
MPSLLTHYNFAKNKTILPKEKALYRLQLLGNQGPDPFFFYGSVGSKNNMTAINSFGSLLHHINPLNLFLFFLDYAQKDLENKNKILAYLEGLISHYILDRNCHPYVFYRTEQENHKNLIDHQRFEANIDRFYQKENKHIHPINAIKANKKDVALISKIFFEFAKSINYENIDENSFLNSYKAMVLAELIIFSFIGIRKCIFNTFLKNSTINAMSTPLKLEGKIDYLNLKKELWQMPNTAKNHYESFPELMQNAEKEYLYVHNLLLKNDIKKELDLFINNTQHDGIKVGDSITYFNSVYKSLS